MFLREWTDFNEASSAARVLTVVPAIPVPDKSREMVFGVEVKFIETTTAGPVPVERT